MLTRIVGLKWPSIPFASMTLILGIPAIASAATTSIFCKFNAYDQPLGELVYFGNALYGTTFAGGSKGSGYIFECDLSKPTLEIANLYSFGTTSGDGGQPLDGLALSNSNGSSSPPVLWGTARGGGSGYGTIFSYSLGNQSYSTNYCFNGNASGSSCQNYGTDNGNYPWAVPLVAGSELFGTTYRGGLTNNCSLGCGLAYAHPAGASQEISTYEFQGSTDGSGPQYPLVQAGLNLLGITSSGGTKGGGTIFKLATGLSDEETISEAPIYNFDPNSTPSGALGGLAYYSGANGSNTLGYYGTASSVGGRGAVYVLTGVGVGSSPTVTTLINFDSFGQPANPQGELAFDGQGTLYGALHSGQSVFSYSPSTGLQNFLLSQNGYTCNPMGVISVSGQSGNTLYGICDGGSGVGALFSVALSGN